MQALTNRHLALAVFMALLVTDVSICSAEPPAVTISELVRRPEQYAGRELSVDGILVEKNYLNAYSPPASTGRTRISRYQFVLADMSGAHMLIITYLPSYDIPDLGLLGKAGTAYSVSGVFYHIPMEPGPPLQFVVPKSRDGFKKK